MSDIRALLLTDVVDSTRITQTLGDEATARCWHLHDRAAHELLATFQGREIERTDGLLATFERASNAVAFALAYHRKLVELGLPFEARAGIHVGPVIRRQSSNPGIALGANPLDVDGLAMSIVARVMGLAQGGQTLLTQSVRNGLQASDLAIRSHGHWQLKGLSEPIEIFEAGDDDARFSPPPDVPKAYRVVRRGDLWTPARGIAHNVPAERDRFFGRTVDLRDIARRYDEGARLVSLLGIGGSGKTRTAIRFAWTWLGEFPGGVWFCDLSQAREVDAIAFAVAQCLDVPLGKADPIVQLAHAIAGRDECLIVLDNFEQLTSFAEATLGQWLARAPKAKFLVTTRELLGIAGEEAIVLAPLPAPDALDLFVTRARAAKQDFNPDGKELAILEGLVTRLDGLPLAIELAAARIRVMNPAALFEQIRDRLDVLTSRGGRRDRQATLRATFDWSWGLLSEVEKSAFAQLSVFEGGFTVESADAVLALPDEIAAVDIVQSLLDKSLIRECADDRFDFLVSARMYAAEHLRSEGRFRGSGEGARLAAEKRHGKHFARLGPKRAVEHACAEADNLVAACRRAVERDDGTTAVDALAGVWSALKLRGPFRAAVELAARVRAIELPLAADAIATRIHGHSLMQCGQMAQARAELESAATKAKRSGDLSAMSISLACLGELAMREGRIDDALEHLQSVLEIRSANDGVTVDCSVLSAMGTCNEYLGRLDEAQAFYERAYQRAVDSGEKRWEGGALGNLGQLNATRGRIVEAQQQYNRALAVAQELGDRQFEGNVRNNLGLLHSGERRYVEAQDHLAAALKSARELGYPRLECIVLCNLGIVAEATGCQELAHQHYLQAVGLARKLGERRYEGQFLAYLGLSHARQGRFGEAEACMQEGAALLRATPDPVSLAVLQCAQAEANYLAGDTHRASELIAEVEAHIRAHGVEPKSELGVALDRARVSIGSKQPVAPPH